MGSGKNRNELCWCGSGQKFKKCHLNRENEPFINVYDAMKEFNKPMKECTAVNLGGCKGKIINAHSVSKSSSLKKIANEGHVYKVMPSIFAINDTKGAVVPKRIGIKQASTFAGFCAEHDRELFSPIENDEFSWCNEHLFLIAYRAFSYEWHAKISIMKKEKSFRSLDSGKDIGDQLVIQSTTDAIMEGTDAGIRHLERQKGIFEKIHKSKEFQRIKWIGFEFDKPPPVMGAGGFTPIKDCNGKQFQDLTDLSTPAQLIYYSSFSVGDRGIFCLVWIDDEGAGCKQFIDSFLEMCNENTINEIIIFMFRNSENLFLQPEWWEGLGEEEKSHLMELFKQNVTWFDGAINRKVLNLSHLKLVNRFGLKT